MQIRTIQYRRVGMWAALLLWAAALPATAQTVQIAKTSQGGVGTFDFVVTNTGVASESITTTVAGTPTSGGTIFLVTDPAVEVTISETPAAGFLLTDASCVDNSGQTPGPIGTLGPGGLTIPTSALLSGAALACSFLNTAQTTDLAITKQASPTVVPSGGTVTFTLTATNVGTADVTDAVLADTPGAGLSCTTDGSCSATGGALCPGSIPAGSLTGGGVTITSMPAGSAVEVTFACTVTATGFPP